ncbi:MAG: tRNA (N(6)-L-threonylcarbamoyladenosine(37)-C(2))-methylthiotransferase [Candidatus Lokiarchaeota archaeon]|nr:tRNA (N(6)-L-threonylcarbamoyladenosine(37)-C(2))-methylthiotransferase [Candidatus Lokiarchaeota archaeon]
MENLSMDDKTFYIETYGCAANKADSYIITDLLQKAGYRKVKFESARIIVINTCGVKEQTENKIRARLKELNNFTRDNPSRKIIIAGCLPHISSRYLQKIKKILPNFSAIIGLNSIFQIPSVVEKINKGQDNLVLVSDQRYDKAKYAVNYPKGKLTGIIPISEGCLGDCTYCCVKNARGKLNCYPPASIIKTIESQLAQGIRQIYLTSQDCSTYTYNGANLSEVMEMINGIEYEFFLRLGMINPQFLINNLNQIIEILEFEKIYQFLHIPIQSASDLILKRMKRHYTLSDIIGNIAILRETLPYLTISTDIICGFPGESEYDFYKTINFIKWLQPEILNISQFTPRPGTKAKKMNQLKSQIIKERSTRLSHIFRQSLKYINEKWLGWEGKILVLHNGSRENQAFGRNFAYKNIFIEDYSGNYGEFVNVEITKIAGFNLFAKKIEK